jgi:hypothetical protein
VEAEGVPLTVSEWLATLARRWPVLLVGIICTACAVLLVHKRPIAYQACGNVAVVLPASERFPNPYNNQETPPVTTTALIAQQLMSDQVQQMLDARGLTASYQAQLVNLGSGQAPIYTEPLASVCASSYDSELSLRTADAVMAEFGTLLHDRELAAHVPSASFMTTVVILQPASAAVTGRPSQAYLGVAAIGLIGTVACTLWIDQLLRRRRGTRRDRDPAPGTGRRRRAYQGF